MEMRLLPFKVFECKDIFISFAILKDPEMMFYLAS